MTRCLPYFAIAALTLGAGPSHAQALAARHLGPSFGNVGRTVFHSQGEWAKAAGAHRWHGGPAIRYPSVQWGREMVLAVSMGEQPTTGYAVHITEVRREGNAIVATVEETRPAPGMLHGQMVTYPSDTVAIPFSRLPVRFVDVASGTEGTRTETTVTERSPVNAPNVPGTMGLAKWIFIAGTGGGFAPHPHGMAVHLVGRPLSSDEMEHGIGKSQDVQVTGAALRTVEQAVRTSGFLKLKARYQGPGMDMEERSVRVFLDGEWHSVSVGGGAHTPAAFETVWNAIQGAAQQR